MTKPTYFVFKRLTQLRSYSYKELWIFMASWVIYLKWDILISVCKYKNWIQHLSPQVTQPKASPKPITIENIRQLILINETAGRNHIRKMNCLRRCLCQKELLNNRAIQSKLHIGVKFVEGKLAAHSWLTHNNQLLNDSSEIVTTYTELTQKLDDKTLSAFM